MPEFEPRIITSFLTEDQIDQVADIWSEWYIGREYLDNYRLLGIPNTVFNYGGGIDYAQRGGFSVKQQGPEGYYYGYAGDGSLEKMDKEMNVVDSTDFIVSDDLTLLENGYAMELVLGVGSYEVFFIDTERMEYVTDGPGTQGEPYSFTMPSTETDFVYDAETDSLYYKSIFSELFEGTWPEIGRIDFSGAPDGSPKEVWHWELYRQRAYLGGGVTSIHLYDGSLYSYSQGILLEYNKDNGRIVGRDNFTSQLPLEIDFAEANIGPEIAQVTPDGTLHIHNRLFSPPRVEGGPDSEPDDPEYFDDIGTYFRYDIDESELTEDVRLYEELEGLLPYDSDEGIVEDVDDDERFEIVDKEVQYPNEDFGLNQDPFTRGPEAMGQVEITPYGFLVSVRSPLFPRMDFYDFNNNLQWRVFSGLFRYGSVNPQGDDINHRTYPSETMVIDQAYPRYSYMPSLWDDPPSIDTEITARTPTEINYQASVFPESRDPTEDKIEESFLDDYIGYNKYTGEPDQEGEDYEIISQEEYRRDYRGADDLGTLDYLFVRQEDGTYNKYTSLGVITWYITNIGSAGESDRVDSVSLRNARNIAVLNRGQVTTTESESASASTTTTTNTKDARAIESPDAVKPLVGIISEKDSDPLFDYEDSVLTTVTNRATTSQLNGDYFANVQLEPVTATALDSDEVGLTATIANPNLLRPTAAVQSTDSFAEGQLRANKIDVVVDVLGEPDEYWRSRTIGVGETTDTQTINF